MHRLQLISIQIMDVYECNGTKILFIEVKDEFFHSTRRIFQRVKIIFPIVSMRKYPLFVLYNKLVQRFKFSNSSVNSLQITYLKKIRALATFYLFVEFLFHMTVRLILQNCTMTKQNMKNMLIFLSSS